MRAMRLIARAAAVLLTGGAAVVVLGTLLHRVPWLGLATTIGSAYPVWIVLAAVAAAVLSWFSWPSWKRTALLAVALLTVAGGAVITGRMAAALGDVSVVRALGIGAARSATPDDEPVYLGSLRLSVYRPAATTPAPVLVYVHGGGWIGGSRADHSADLRWFADRGWLTVSVGYTLSSADRHLWDVTPGQIACALAWTARNAARYGGDPARLSVTGDSAGGNLAMNAAGPGAGGPCAGPFPPVRAVAVTYPVVDAAAFHGNPDPVLGDDARAMAAAYTGGTPAEFPERYASLDPTRHLTAATPPTLLIVGEGDHLVPPEGAYRYAAQARASGAAVRLVRVPYAEHAFDAPAGSLGQQGYRTLTAAWLRDHG